MTPELAITVAVVTGGHAFDVVNFHQLFRSLDGIDAYIQHMDDFAHSSEAVRDSYNAVLFYSMMVDMPTDGGLPGYAGKPKTMLEHLGETEQGIVILHHAILAYPQWPTWNKIVGIQDRGFDYFDDQTVRTEIAAPDHPVTQGLADWEMVDETYLMNDAGEGCEVLLTTDHPQSMHTLAWAHHYRKARVFCYAAGHDDHAWSNPNFRQMLTRGLVWTAKRL
jgi:hypothetical protein